MSAVRGSGPQDPRVQGGLAPVLPGKTDAAAPTTSLTSVGRVSAPPSATAATQGLLARILNAIINFFSSRSDTPAVKSKFKVHPQPEMSAKEANTLLDSPRARKFFAGNDVQLKKAISKEATSTLTSLQRAQLEQGLRELDARRPVRVPIQQSIYNSDRSFLKSQVNNPDRMQVRNLLLDPFMKFHLETLGNRTATRDSIDFLSAVNKHKAAGDPEVAKKEFIKVYQQFLAPGAPQRINLPSGIMSNLTAEFERAKNGQGGFSPHLFEAAAQDIESMVQTNMLQTRGNPPYQEFTKAVQSELG